VADVVIADTAAPGAWVVQAVKSGRAPRYPEGARAASVAADVVASFIVDTTGGVVPRSAAIERARAWHEGPQSAAGTEPTIVDFSLSVCEYVRLMQFAPIRPRAGGPPVRARLTVPITFRVVATE
jgi:hypothetical protein